MMVRVDFDRPMSQYIELDSHQEGLWKAYVDAREAVCRVGWYHENDAIYDAQNDAWEAFVGSINLDDIDVEDLIDDIHETKW